MRPGALRSFRLLQGMSLYELAQKVGISESMLSYVERGRRGIDREGQKRIAAALGCEVDLVFPSGESKDAE